MRYLPLLLILTACQGATSPMTDAGDDHADAHMLRFDADADAETAADGLTSNNDSAADIGPTADSAADIGPTADSGTDALQTDSLIIGDSSPCINPPSSCHCESNACTAEVQCQSCIRALWLGQAEPAYCAGNALYQAYTYCLSHS